MDNAILQELVGKVCTLTQSAGFIAEQGMVEAVSDGWVRMRLKNGEVRYLNLRHVVNVAVMPQKVQIKWREKL